AVGWPAWHQGAHSRSDIGVEKVDIETDVQVGVVIEPCERLLHRLAHAHLIDVAHVEDFHGELVQEALLAFVDTAHTDLPYPLRVDARSGAAELRQGPRPEAAETGERHTVQIAAGIELAGVEIRMCIQPEHAQLPA